jgi:hypothetical protein
MSSPEERIGRATTKRWLDQLETILEQEARLAGFLDHGSSIGNAREFFVKRVLRSVLPPMVYIGTGKVIGATSVPSNQIDVIIFDPRFPILEIEPGMGLYPVEGVIATIEVKSTLDSKKLTIALENCFSVMKVSPYFVREDFDIRAKELATTKKLNPSQSMEMLMLSLQPRTYVFGFAGYTTADSLGEAVEKWYRDKGNPGSILRPLLPRVIVSEKAIGLSADNLTILPESNDPKKAVVMQFIASEKRFGLFVLHLINAVSERLGTIHNEERVRYGYDRYFPWQEYMAELSVAGGPVILRDR